MTRKDYIALAEALSMARAQVSIITRQAASHAAMVALDHACDRIADVLAADNARFDRARFLTAARRTEMP